MSAKRLLAIDFGDRRTGLAATDYTGSVSLPLPALRNLTDDECAQQIAELARDRQTELIVLGLPLSQDGHEGPRAKRTREFEQLLIKHAPCPLTTEDESHTTDEAHGLLKAGGMKAAQRKTLADSVAALVLLRRYLSYNG